VVRYLAFCFAGFFAGIAGALAAINFEIANSAYLGAVQSGTVLFATYIGGIGFSSARSSARSSSPAVARPERLTRSGSFISD
jgi:ribose/xylose/arabinose/galactoside ABC-type transport system permease subunit